ncbi:MAG: prepilin peptidase [Sedimenticola sp.]
MIGSFLNVVAYRLALMMKREWKSHCRELPGPSAYVDESHFTLSRPRSACPKCGQPIPVPAKVNIPVISYLLLRGRCSECKAPIPPRYPIVELTTGILSLIVAWHFDFNWQCAAAFP